MKIILVYFGVDIGKIKTFNIHSFFSFEFWRQIQGHFVTFAICVSENFSFRMTFWWVFRVEYAGDQVFRLMTSVGNVGTDSVRVRRVENHQAQQHFARQHVLASWSRTLFYAATSLQSKSAPWMTRPIALLVKICLQRVGGDCRSIVLYLSSWIIPGAAERKPQRMGVPTYLN